MSHRILHCRFSWVVFLSLPVVVFVVPAVASTTEENERVSLSHGRIDWTSDNLDSIINDMLEGSSFSVNMFGHTVNNSKTGGTLSQIKTHSSWGRDVHGKFQKTVEDWTADSWPHDSKVYFQTSIKRYMELKSINDGTGLKNNPVAVVFTQRYPQGIMDCTEVDDKKRRMDNVREHSTDNVDPTASLRSTFPSLDFGTMHYFSYGGCFLEQHDVGRFPTHLNATNNNRLRDGVEAGPLLFFQHRSDSSSNNKNKNSRNDTQLCGIISHFNEFMTQSTQHEAGTSIVAHGPMDSICPIPAGFEAKTIVVLHRGASIHNAVQMWGKMLQNEHMGHGQRRTHDVDYTTRYLGYSTDNGAYYYYHKEEDWPVTSNMEETMIALHNYSIAAKIPYRYWLLDSWWYYKSNGKIAGVTNWTARPDVFPHGLGYLYHQTRMFVQAHNRMWSTDNVYSKDYNFIPSESNPVSLPTEYRFWKDLLQKAIEWGLVVYEQDWLNVQFERQSQAFTNATLMRSWLMEMGRAAQDCHVAVQYCMPLPRHILQSVEIPAVTQVRASGDYVAGLWIQQWWNVAVSSLLYVALDLKPSKDNAWSKSIQPNNTFQNTTEPFPEFQALLLAMSTGPVAFSDKIGHSNTSLILRTCRTDGVLLQPAQPLIPILNGFTNGPYRRRS
jgi:hypothetical protein